MGVSGQAITARGVRKFSDDGHLKQKDEMEAHCKAMGPVTLTLKRRNQAGPALRSVEKLLAVPASTNLFGQLSCWIWTPMPKVTNLTC